MRLTQDEVGTIEDALDKLAAAAQARHGLTVAELILYERAVALVRNVDGHRRVRSDRGTHRPRAQGEISIG